MTTPGESTKTEWAVRWDEEGDDHNAVVSYDTRNQAVNVARIYGYGTPESKVSVVHRTVTYGPWIADAG